MPGLAHISDVLPAVAESTFLHGYFEWPQQGGSISGPSWLSVYLREELRQQCSLDAQIHNDNSELSATIQLTYGGLGNEARPLLPALRREAYKICVRQASILVVAEEDAGLFYGTQTLLQLFAAATSKARSSSSRPRIEQSRCFDYPRFRWCAHVAWL